MCRFFLFPIDIAKISYFIENSRKTLLILVKLRSALFLKPQNSLDIERGGCGFREHCSLNTIMRFYRRASTPFGLREYCMETMHYVR